MLCRKYVNGAFGVCKDEERVRRDEICLVDFVRNIKLGLKKTLLEVPYSAIVRFGMGCQEKLGLRESPACQIFFAHIVDVP